MCIERIHLGRWIGVDWKRIQYVVSGRRAEVTWQLSYVYPRMRIAPRCNRLVPVFAVLPAGTGVGGPQEYSEQHDLSSHSPASDMLT